MMRHALPPLEQPIEWRSSPFQRASDATFFSGRIVMDRKHSLAFYRAEDYSPDASLGHLMKRIVVSMLRQADVLLKPCRLTNVQRGFLMCLKMEGCSTVSDIARSLQVDAGATTRLADRLERSGHCRRQRSRTDRREVTLALTPEGEHEISGVPTALCQVLNAHLAGFSDAELSTLKDYLGRMRENGRALGAR